MPATKTVDVKPAPALRPCRRAMLQINHLEDGCVVYHPEQERVHFLNQTAAAVLELCDGHHGFEDIEARLADRFDLREPGRNLAGDIIRRFIEEGLVMLEAEPPAMAAGAAGAQEKR